MSHWFKSLFVILGALFMGGITGIIFVLMFVPTSPLAFGLGFFALPLACAVALGAWYIIAAAIGAFTFTHKVFKTGSIVQAGEELNRITVPPGRIAVLFIPIGVCFLCGILLSALSSNSPLLVTSCFTLVGGLYGSALYFLARHGFFDELLWPKDGGPEF